MCRLGLIWEGEWFLLLSRLSCQALDACAGFSSLSGIVVAQGVVVYGRLHYVSLKSNDFRRRPNSERI